MRSNAVLVVDEVLERPAIEVRDKDGFKGVYARQAIPKDSVIFTLRGSILTRPSKYTIELGSKQHLNVPPHRKANNELDYCWQYLNHCCEPNGYINISERSFRALRDITPGEQITFNYLTTESEMAVPFNCTCRSPNCFGYIRGRHFLTTAEGDRLALILGENNVVPLLMPAIEKVSRTSKHYDRPSQSS